MSTLNISEFRGGIQSNFDSTKLPQGSYFVGINLRNRRNIIEPIRKPVNLVGPVGLKYQNLSGFGQYLLMFVDGQGYYFDTSLANGEWNPIQGAVLDPNVQDIDVCAVPVSSMNLKRKGEPSTVERVKPIIKGSVAGALAMDGKTQPVFIEPTLGGVIGRRAQDYDQWTLDYNDQRQLIYGTTQEYVPIGRFPFVINRKTYMMGFDIAGRLTLMFSSVSGRPLDFVINIDAQGNKSGDATTVAESFAYDEVRALFPGMTTVGGLILCTDSATFVISPNTQPQDLMFAEPTYTSTYVFESGAVNNRSFVEVNGAATFIGPKGIQRFDTVAQIGTESNNVPFAREIAQFLSPRPQSRTCAIKFDDYAFYAVDTIYGPGVAVYDMTNESWASIDLYHGMGKIVQFARTFIPGSRRLFAITDRNEIWELFASQEFEVPRMYIGDIASGDAAVAQQVSSVALLFSRTIQEFDVQIEHYYNRRLISTDNQHIVVNESDDLQFPVQVPFATPQDSLYKTVQSQSTSNEPTNTCGWLISWTGPAQLAFFSATIASSESQDPKVIQLANSRRKKVVNEEYGFIADFAPNSYAELTDEALRINCANVSKLAYAQILKDLQNERLSIVLGGGDYLYEPFNEVIPCFWPQNIEFEGVAGNHDLDRADEYYAYFGGRRYWSQRYSDLLEVFFLNGGWTTPFVGLNRETRDPGPATKEPDGNTPESQQALWFSTTARTSTAKFKIAIIHEPPYTSENRYWPGYEDLRWPFEGMDLVLSGHAHVYERLNVHGRTYITAGTGGHSLTGFAEDHIHPNSVVRIKEYGHLHITVSQFKLTVKFIKAGGGVLDTYQINS